MARTNRLPIGTAIAVVVGLACLGACPDEQPTGLFAGLEVGQSVNIKDLGTVYEITVLGEDLPAGYEVIEAGADYLGVRDHAGIVEPRIPVTSIKSVAWMRVGFGPQPSPLQDLHP